MQDAYVRAYEHLDQFAGRSMFSTWLTRIAVHEAQSFQFPPAFSSLGASGCFGGML